MKKRAQMVVQRFAPMIGRQLFLRDPVMQAAYPLG
jgi:hypothetical protein